MSAFGFMETSFFISLGISFVLILLLVYHFKQRLITAEGKLDTMFEIINNLAQELSNVKSVIVHNNRPSTPFPHNAVIGQNTPILSDNIKRAIDEDIEEDSDDEGEYSDDEDEDSETDEDSDDEKIIVSDVDEDDISVDIIISNDEIIVDIINTNDEILDAEIVQKDESMIDVTQDLITELPDFAKMNLGDLRTYITEKGWIEDASKMKKAQIIKLIESRDVA